MEWDAWRPLYEAICAEFGFDPQADLASARLLRDVMPPSAARWRDLGVEIRRREIAILGAGPSLEKTPLEALHGVRIIAADGASSWCSEHAIVPDVVVTDLDGGPVGLAWAARKGTQMVIHAHGDNMAALRALGPGLGPRWHGTYQCAPAPGLDGLHNVGGFTDGDRAVLLAEALGARSATLYGFDFDGPAGRYSGRYDPATKPRKLAWAQRLVAGVHERGGTRITVYKP